jgi:hypothetical protein
MTNIERIAGVKVLIEAGLIKSHADIFNYIPKTFFTTVHGCNYQTLCRKIQSPKLFSFHDIVGLSELLDMEAITICQLVLNDIFPPDKKHTRKM